LIEIYAELTLAPQADALSAQPPDLQTAIVKKLVNSIEIKSEGFEIEFLVGKERLSRELGATAPGSADFRQSEPTKLFLVSVVRED
jgi:hypothetical protein